MALWMLRCGPNAADFHCPTALIFVPAAMGWPTSGV